MYLLLLSELCGSEPRTVELIKHRRSMHTRSKMIEGVYEGGGAEKGIGGIWKFGKPGNWGEEGILGMVGIEDILGTGGIEGMVGIEGIGGMDGRDDGCSVGMVGKGKGKGKLGSLGRLGMAEPPPAVGVLCCK